MLLLCVLILMKNFYKPIEEEVRQIVRSLSSYFYGWKIIEMLLRLMDFCNGCGTFRALAMLDINRICSN